MNWLDGAVDWLNANPAVKLGIKIFIIHIIAFAAYFITKRIILKGMGLLVKKSKTEYDDIIFDKILSKKLAYIPPILIAYNFANLIPSLKIYIERISFALIFWVLLSSLVALLKIGNDIYDKKKQFSGRPIKGIVQVVSLVLYVIGGLVTVGILAGKSPMILLSGVGALTAVILLIFRDTILSFVASLQITTNDLVRLNDWIEVPAFGADGDVVDIALHTIKVQNFDKTITVIPTHKLIDVTFKNWRGMQESGGRRIKRSIAIDIDSIKLCDEAMLEKFKKIEYIKEYIEKKQKEVEDYNKEHKVDTSELINGRRLTNVGTFRAYLQNYLRNHPDINEDMTFLVRQLAPGSSGLPIEIYIFTNDTRWVIYEDIQANIFDHLLAVVKEFDLRVFQNPSGKDFSKIVNS